MFLAIGGRKKPVSDGAVIRCETSMAGMRRPTNLPLSRCQQHLERSIDAPFNAARLAVSKATVGAAHSKTANACASTTAKLGKAAYSSEQSGIRLA
jgi:hypothetical protein